jgi:hypothetical protein
MCDCKTLTSKWWARPNFDSDHEAAERGWQQVSRVGSGWAVLWRCPSCGRHWQGIVACSRSSQDCIEWVFDHDVKDWFDKAVADYERFIQEERVSRRAIELFEEYQKSGYEVDIPVYYDPFLGIVPWMRYVAYWRKGKPKQALLLTLARNGGVCVQEAK